MQETDFLECEFNGDPAKYILEVTTVADASFECRLLSSGEQYTFDADTMTVTSLFGAIPAGSRLATYTRFAASGAQPFQTGGYVAVTFADGSRLLGQLTDVDASDDKSITFLDSGSHYVFSADNTIVSTDSLTPLVDVSTIESYSADPPVLVVSAAGAGTAAALQTSAAMNGYVPRNRDTVVVDMQEFASGIANFENWSTNAALHNRAAKPARAASAIAFIVLHETSGSDAGTGFDPPFTSHFVVGTNALRQFNDLCEAEWHAGIFNDRGIGIEFKNQDWVTVKAPGHEYIDAHWSGDYPSYTLPSTDTLENLVLLLQRLLSKSEGGFPAVDPTWLQLVSYNEISSVWELDNADVPPDDKKGLKKFFVYGSGTGYLAPGTLDASVTGILSHNSVSNVATLPGGQEVIDEDSHTDGSFQALYTWLRIMQSNEMNDAYTNARDLVTNHVVKVLTIQSYQGYNRPNANGPFVLYSEAARRHVFLIDVESML
jgi:hypothetical protein